MVTFVINMFRNATRMDFYNLCMTIEMTLDPVMSSLLDRTMDEGSMITNGICWRFVRMVDMYVLFWQFAWIHNIFAIDSLLEGNSFYIPTKICKTWLTIYDLKASSFCLDELIFNALGIEGMYSTGYGTFEKYFVQDLICDNLLLIT